MDRWIKRQRNVAFDAAICQWELIGGGRKIAEIDGSKFGKRKYNRGKRVEGQWIGGVERGSKRSFLVPVPTRSRKCLIPIIKHWILPGTTSISDCWKAYNAIP